MRVLLILRQQLPGAVVIALVLQLQAWINVYRQVAATAPRKAAEDRCGDAVGREIASEDFRFDRIGGNVECIHVWVGPGLD